MKLSKGQIFINVGGRASAPPLPGLDQVRYFNNSTMMEVDFLPEHLIVVVGGYIGLEFGQMYRRFGSEVTIVEMASRLIKREGEDVSQASREILENEGIAIRLNTECIPVEKNGDKVAVNLDCSSGDKRVFGSHLLIAVGRGPNTDDLGLEKAGVAVDQQGYIQVDDQLLPMCQAFTPWATATAKELSPAPLITTMRSSPPIFWTATRGGSATGSPPMRSTRIRRWGGREPPKRNFASRGEKLWLQDAR
jgi:Pyridine nucleotide-disulphide oxidoreductase